MIYVSYIRREDKLTREIRLIQFLTIIFKTKTKEKIVEVYTTRITSMIEYKKTAYIVLWYLGNEK